MEADVRPGCGIGDLSQVNVFAISGKQEGNAVLNGQTTHEGLDALLQRCAFWNSVDVQAELLT